MGGRRGPSEHSAASKLQKSTCSPGGTIVARPGSMSLATDLPMKPKSAPLSALVASLASDAVRIQRTLDAESHLAEEDFQRLAARVPEAARQFLLPLAPVRRLVAEHRVRASIRIGQSLTVQGELRVAPVHLGFGALYRNREQAVSTVEIEVAAVPQPRGASPEAPGPSERG